MMRLPDTLKITLLGVLLGVTTATTTAFAQCDPDVTPPTITMLGSSPVTVECGTTYSDAGATAFDNCDGDLTSSIVLSLPGLTPNEVGTIYVTYNVTDSAGNPAAEVRRTLNVVDTKPPVITLNGTATVTVECGGTYTDAGATAQDQCEGNITSDIEVNNPVKSTEKGTYSVTYDVTDQQGNTATRVTRTVNVVDNTPPVLTLNGPDALTIDCGSVYTDAGATALDSCDGVITNNINTTNPVNTAIGGVYTITYAVADGSGNNAVPLTRTVTVVDTTAPTITLNGANPVTVECGSVFTDAGATASDGCEGDLTSSIVVSNPVNSAVVGTYTVTYNVSDTVGNIATQVTRTVNVVDATAPVITLNPPNNILSIPRGSPGSYPIATANDSCDGDLTANIITGGIALDTSRRGFYFRTYTVTDSEDNTSVSVCVISVYDTIAVNNDCQAEVPDFLETLEQAGIVPTPWPEDATLTQFPQSGTVSPGEITEADWPEEMPGAFPQWPADVFPVRILISGYGSLLCAEIKDQTLPQIRDGAPNLFQRIEVDSSPATVQIPDFISRLKPFIYDNCSVPEALVFTQNPSPGTATTLPILPAGRNVIVTATDESLNSTSFIARLEVVNLNTARPVIIPVEVNESDRRFEGDEPCLEGWDCGPIAYWFHYWECGVPWDDPGATAYDPVTNADLTHLIQSRLVDGVVGDHDTGDTTDGFVAFTIRYWIGDESDTANNGLVERRVVIRDINDPVITLGAIGGGPSGAQPIYRNWPASSLPDWEDPEWVADMRRAITLPWPWNNFLSVFDFVPVAWNDDTAMPWRCQNLQPYEEFLDVYDDCDGLFDQATLDANVLVIITKVRYASEIYDAYEETFYAVGFLGELRNAGLDLPWGRPATGNPNPWYGYRIYYIAKDDSNNFGFMSRHVNIVSGEGILLAEPTTITITCDGNGLEQLAEVERRDTAWSVCRGEVTHLIRGTGGIDMTPEGYYVPGTYYREYAIEGGQIWQFQWRRTIIVEDTPPDVLIYDELGNEVEDEIVSGCISRENIIVVPWCEFLNWGDPGDTPVEQADDWAANWWAAQPRYNDTEIGTYGYYANHICDDDTMLTAWVDVRGLGVITAAMVNIYETGNLYALGKYPINYTLNYPPHDLAAARRSVLLTEDISLDLVFSPAGTVVEETGDRTIVRMECGAGYPFVLPQIGRVWDNCTGMAIDRNIIIDAYEVVNEELVEVPDPALISTARTGVYLLYYGAVYAGSPIAAPVRTVELRVEDTAPPVLTLLGDEEMMLECNQPFVDPGATAVDACDGNLTAAIVISGYPNTATTDSVGYRTYTVTDSAGNIATVVRTIIIPGLDIVLNDVDGTEIHPTYGPVQVTEWECNLDYVDPGVASATDECTGQSIPLNLIQVSGIPSATPPLGEEFLVTYTLSYGGNTVTIYRLVRVLNADGPVITLQDGVDPPVTGETPVADLEEADPDPAWWTDAQAWVADKYPSGRPQLPEEWRVAEAWDDSLSEPLPWICDVEPYVDPGAGAFDVCDDAVVAPARILLILTEYNAEEDVEYFRYAGFFDDFAANPPGHAFDEDATEPFLLNLRDDPSGAVWKGYRAYYLAWDLADNYSVASRLIDPSYLLLAVTPQDATAECGGALPESTVVAEDQCTGEVLSPARWIWHVLPGGGLEMDGAVPMNYDETAAMGQPGEYYVLYAVTDSLGNSMPELDTDGQPVDPEGLVEAGGPYLQHLLVQDMTAPVITLVGGTPIEIPYGQPFVDPGYSAIDACDGDLTGSVQISKGVDPFRLGLHTITYTVTDAAGNRAEQVREVYVVDVSEPQIIVLPAIITLECSTIYTDAGVRAVDNADGTDLTSSIQVSGLVSSLIGTSGARPGTYVITYRVSRFPGGNEATATRTVIVTDSEPPVLTLRGEASVTVECGASYRDAGVMSALDECDGDVFRRVVQLGNVDTNVSGLQVITYSARDQAGNEGTVTRSVTVNSCEGEGEAEGELEGEPEGEAPAQVSVPDVVLEAAEEAQALLAAVGLPVGETECVCNDDVPQGSVISQSPAPGALVDPGTPISLQISDGPCTSGCDGMKDFNWAGLFLGILATIVLLVLTFCFGGEIIKI